MQGLLTWWEKERKRTSHLCAERIENPHTQKNIYHINSIDKFLIDKNLLKLAKFSTRIVF